MLIDKERNYVLERKQIFDLSRKDWEKIVKSKIIKRIEQLVRKSENTKMRFIKKGYFGIKEYIEHKKGTNITKIEIKNVGGKERTTLDHLSVQQAVIDYYIH